MLPKHPIQELIRRMNLLHGSGTRNNNLARTKDAHRNAFTIPIPISCSLALTEARAAAHTRTLVVRIEEELGIHPLINRLFQHAEQLVFLNEEPMEIVLLNIVTERIVGVNEGHIHLCNRRYQCGIRRCKGTSLETLDDIEKPLDGTHGKLLARHSRHLDAPVAKQLHVDLLESITERATQNERILIIERLVRGFAIGEEVLVAGSMDLLLMLKLQDAF